MKKIIGFFCCLLLLGACQQQKGYVINGTAKNVKEGKIYLQVFRNKMYFDVDTADIVNGKFTFKGKVEQPVLYGLIAGEMKYPVPFFLENKKIDLTLEEDGKTVTIPDSPLNDLFFLNAQEVFLPEFSIDQLVTEHPESPASAYYLYRYFTYQLPLDSLKIVRDKLAPSLATYPYVMELDSIIARLEKVEIGQTAPDFSLPDASGTEVSLDSFRGKYVLLDFWASWCPPCRRENPNIVKAFQTYKNKNFTIIGISLDKEKGSWLKAIADDQLAWTHVSDLKFWDSEVPALYGVRGIPANILLDPDGVILAKNLYGEDLQKKLAELLH
ncbi:TlpA disulfide reductase family protein [Parabacteroides sp. Marseille-P3160]|uniref:TlpA disulfide reductase family protein n=1 Tax=Parabacteroides sp. Marseille-P3160 TaxID=1917887 RepID=UPI0009BA371F|nr:TlpA disulfide reductase family protein [Parabacteroides sp. Marseille-P3160]